MKYPVAVIATILVLFINATNTYADDNPLPVPRLFDDSIEALWNQQDYGEDAIVIDVGERKFSPFVHKELTPEIRFCSDPINQAIWMQDIFHQFESRAHFDNCDFHSSASYVTQLREDAKALLIHAKQLQKRGVSEYVIRFRVQQAMRILGQALHAVQDFYAHTNYVEMHVKKGTPHIKDIERIPFWTEPGKRMMDEQLKNGLYSGVVFWGFPQKCPDGTLSHHEINKDSEESTAGSVETPWNGRLQFDAAVELAQLASHEFTVEMFEQYPLLKEVCGDVVFVTRQADHRMH